MPSLDLYYVSEVIAITCYSHCTIVVIVIVLDSYLSQESPLFWHIVQLFCLWNTIHWIQWMPKELSPVKYAGKKSFCKIE